MNEIILAHVGQHHETEAQAISHYIIAAGVIILITSVIALVIWLSRSKGTVKGTEKREE